MKNSREIILVALLILLAPAGPAAARLLELEDFTWGLPLNEVERRAQDRGWRLRGKDISLPEPRLEYRAFYQGGECLLHFFFTPLSGKLYSVTATWDSAGWGNQLRQKLITDFGEPREEIPGAGISIWTRRNTELTLRDARAETTLTYSHLLLWEEAREEKKILRKKENEG
jgi:hypothetical protein